MDSPSRFTSETLMRPPTLGPAVTFGPRQLWMDSPVAAAIRPAADVGSSPVQSARVRHLRGRLIPGMLSRNFGSPTQGNTDDGLEAIRRRFEPFLFLRHGLGCWQYDQWMNGSKPLYTLVLLVIAYSSGSNGVSTTVTTFPVGASCPQMAKLLSTQSSKDIVVKTFCIPRER